MLAHKLKTFLDEHQVKYVVIQHSPAFTSQEIAASAHVPGKELAKTVVVKVDGRMTMVVVPGSAKVDLEELRETLRAKRVELAGEREFKDRFPDCEVGAMPPFGNLYGMDVYVASVMKQHPEMAFNAGSHTELIRLYYRDFERLVDPKPLVFAHVS